MKTKFIIALVLVSSLFALSISQSQAFVLAKPFTGKINKAVATTIVKKIESRGFAAYDPVYAATLQSTEAVLNTAVAAGSVAATAAAIGSAPVWLSVALGIGAAYEIYDWTMGQYEFKADPATQKVKLITSGAANTPEFTAPAPGVAPIPPSLLPIDYSNPGVGNQVNYPNDLPLCATLAATQYSARLCGPSVQVIQAQADTIIRNYIIELNAANSNRQLLSITPNYPNPTKLNCTINSYICPQGVNYQYAYTYGYSYKTLDNGQTLSTTVTGNYQIFNNPYYIQPGKLTTLNDAAAKLTEPDLASRADPALIAAVANKLWQQAAQQPGYQGAAYNPADVITEEDILSAINTGLFAWPTVSDLLSALSANPQTQPQLDPNAQPVEQPSQPSPEVTLDLGPDPGIGQPGLENTPTGESIVQSVMGLLPSLSAFTIPQHTSQCEAPAFEFFGNQYSLQVMCDQLENQRALLSTIFSAIWGVASLALILRA